MHIRFSTCIGTAVLVEEDQERVGMIVDLLIQPDTGKIEGFYIEIDRFASRDVWFLAAVDILRWGEHIYVRDREVVSPVEDLIRLQPLLEEHRPVYGQRIVTDSGRYLGKCADVQLSTESMHIEWIFPRKWWRWRPALPVSEITEVRREAVIVREPHRFARATADHQVADSVRLPEVEAPAV